MHLKTYNNTVGCGLEVVQMSLSEGNSGCTDILMLAIAPMLWSDEEQETPFLYEGRESSCEEGLADTF